MIAALFDLDGTLTDPREAGPHALCEGPPQVAEALAALTRTPR